MEKNIEIHIAIKWHHSTWHQIPSLNGNTMSLKSNIKYTYERLKKLVFRRRSSDIGYKYSFKYWPISALLSFDVDWSIQRSPKRYTQYNLVRYSYVMAIHTVTKWQYILSLNNKQYTLSLNNNTCRHLLTIHSVTKWQYIPSLNNNTYRH